MNKSEFLQALERHAAALPEQERERLTDYFGELIDDSLEAGVPEDEAVAALGDPEALARELCSAVTQTGGTGERSRTLRSLNSLRIRVNNADVRVVRAPLDNGAAAQVRFSNPSRFTWRADGGELVIQENESALRFNLRSLREFAAAQSLKVVVTLAVPLQGMLQFESNGGDLTAEGIALGGEVRLASASGDFRLKDMECGSDVIIQSRSGDADLDGVTAGGDLRVKTASGDLRGVSLSLKQALCLETVSGDIELREFKCGALRLDSTSGDIEAERGHVGTASVRAVSGDVRLNELETDPEITVQTTSGDISMVRSIARVARLRSSSGDISLRLAALPCGYDLSATSRAGDIRLPEDNPAPQPGALQPRIIVQTTSGDIHAELI